MFLGEPPATQADLHFRLFGFPVRVHPYFWVVTLLMGLGGGPADPQKTMIWVGGRVRFGLAARNGARDDAAILRRAPVDHAVWVWGVGVVQ